MPISESSRGVLLKLIEDGLRNSVATLAQISGAKWKVDSVSAHVSPPDKLISDLKENDESCYGVSFSMPGGAFLMLFSPPSGLALTNSFVVGRRPPGQGFDADGITEISNIIVNSVIAPLADACGVGFLISAPEISRGAAEELFGRLLKHFQVGGEAYPIMAWVRMSSESSASSCTLLILFNDYLLERLSAVL